MPYSPKLLFRILESLGVQYFGTGKARLEMDSWLPVLQFLGSVARLVTTFQLLDKDGVCVCVL